MQDTVRSGYCGCLYFSANALARSITRIAERAFAGTSLSPSYAFVLMTVSKNPGITPTGLAHELQLERSTITRLLDHLEQKALLRRRTAGRCVTVQATAAGRRLARKASDSWQQLYRDYADVLGHDQAIKLTEEIYAAHESLQVL